MFVYECYYDDSLQNKVIRKHKFSELNKELLYGTSY
jgi:hypothetical protein